MRYVAIFTTLLPLTVAACATAVDSSTASNDDPGSIADASVDDALGASDSDASNDDAEAEVDANGASGSGGAEGDSGGEGGSGGEDVGGSGGGVAGAGGSGECTPGETENLGECGSCGSLEQTCSSSGEWQAAECKNQGACVAGATDTEACGNCGTRSRTCGASCTWGSFGTCTGVGVCAPGAVEDCMCSTNETSGVSACCGQRTCTSSCDWGTCGLKSGNTCEYKAGTNWQCCGASSWQFCLSSCTWAPCQTCPSCSC